jgi:hypothetical protein
MHRSIPPVPAGTHFECSFWPDRLFPDYDFWATRLDP